MFEEEEIRWMYDVKGMTQQEIADYYGVTQGAIAHYVKKYGIKARKIKLPECDIRIMYEYESMNIKEIADYYGVSAMTIWNCMEEYGIERKTSGEAHLKYHTHEERREAQR